MYRCLECGHLFEDGEEAVVIEDRGEFCGSPCSEELSVCPICHGVYAETVRCQVCDSEHFEEELTGGVCEECFEKYQYDVDMCYRLSADDKSSVKINSFLYTMFDEEEIEQILFEALKERQKYVQIDRSKFIDDDKEWFGEALAEEINKK